MRKNQPKKIYIFFEPIELTFKNNVSQKKAKNAYEIIFSKKKKNCYKILSWNFY